VGFLAVRGGKDLRPGGGHHKIRMPMSPRWCTFIDWLLRKHEHANLKEAAWTNRYALTPNRQGKL
jgi:hypothetical protein